MHEVFWLVEEMNGETSLIKYEGDAMFSIQITSQYVFVIDLFGLFLNLSLIAIVFMIINSVVLYFKRRAGENNTETDFCETCNAEPDELLTIEGRTYCQACKSQAIQKLIENVEY